MVNKKVYYIGGHAFKILPTTIGNRQKVSDAIDAAFSSVGVNADSVSTLSGLLSAFDEIVLFFELFKLITEGPHEKLVLEEFDQKIGEDALEVFSPAASVTMMKQIGFLPL